MSPLLPQGKVVLGSERIGTSHVWWLMPVIPAIWKHRQEGQEFKAILCYIVSLRLAQDTQDSTLLYRSDTSQPSLEKNLLAIDGN